MPVVALRAPLSGLADGQKRVSVGGRTVGDALLALERSHPPLAGWILDERGQIRRHITVFVNEVRADAHTAVAEDDRIHVLPAISGGGR